MRLEIDAVRRCLPQRYPMLLVDRVLEVVPGESVRAQKAISIGDYCYRNIADGGCLADYAYPVSLIIEALSQAAGLLLHNVWSNLTRSTHMVIFGGFAGVRIISDAYPGDVLDLDARLETLLDDAVVITGIVHVGERRILFADRITAAIRPVAALEGR